MPIIEDLTLKEVWEVKKAIRVSGAMLLVMLLPVFCFANTGTLFFENPIQLEAGGVPIDLGNHADTRLVDWDGDNDLDLLVGGGDGYIWLFENSVSADDPYFEAGIKVQSSGIDIQAGTTNVGACFKDFTGDNLPDLIVAHSYDRVRIYINTGSLVNPEFNGFFPMEGPTGELFLPSLCWGRIDVADWDGDGLMDIVTGEWGGYITLYLNDGTVNSPHFQEGERFTYNGQDIAWAYNIHPRIYDVNQDGLPDLAYGINWGEVFFYVNDGSLTNPHLKIRSEARGTKGGRLNIRHLIDDDTTPDFADLNNDQVLDMISGGLNGKIFIMYGIPYTTQLAQIDQIMQDNAANLGSALDSDPDFRGELFGIHYGIRSFANEFLVFEETRQPITDWYMTHIDNYPQYLLKQYLDPTIHTYVPSLAGQVWINLFESLPDTQTHRINVANKINFQGYYRDIFLDFGTLFIENSNADLLQQQVVYNYLSLLPRQLWDAEKITIAGFLGPYEGIESRTGVNIFSCRVGEYSENSFPSDSPPGLVDLFSACLAHEINHTVDSYTFGENRSMLERKYSLIEQAAQPDVVFCPHSVGLGIDWTATKARFQAQGYWNGVEDDWNQAWADYWSTGPGVTVNENWLRNNLKLMCEAPQEAFATLANQYFTDSRIMLNLALSRWDRGITSCINQFLFFVDVYSCGGSKSYFYTIDTSGNITRSSVCVGRNQDGHIDRLGFDQSIYEFFLNQEGNVTDISGPVPFDALIADISCNFCVNLDDFALLAAYWLQTDCNDCGGADLNQNSDVELGDILTLSQYWLGQPFTKIYDNAFDTDPCWSTAGEWSFGQPGGSGGTYGNPDPSGGLTGNNVYGVTLNGDYSTTLGGPYYLTAGPFDCTGYQNVMVQFARWLNTDEPGYVRSVIEVSNDGLSWDTIWENTGRSAITDGVWTIMKYNLGDIADNQEEVYIRWGYEIFDYAYPYSGWNIDDIGLWGNN